MGDQHAMRACMCDEEQAAALVGDPPQAVSSILVNPKSLALHEEALDPRRDALVEVAQRLPARKPVPPALEVPCAGFLEEAAHLVHRKSLERGNSDLGEPALDLRLEPESVRDGRRGLPRAMERTYVESIERLLREGLRDAVGLGTPELGQAGIVDGPSLLRPSRLRMTNKNKLHPLRYRQVLAGCRAAEPRCPHGTLASRVPLVQVLARYRWAWPAYLRPRHAVGVPSRKPGSARR